MFNNVNSQVLRTALEAAPILKKWMYAQQTRALYANMRDGSEEAPYFAQLAGKLRERIEAVRPLYYYDESGEKAMAQLHYFRGGTDLYIAESEGPEGRSFGFCVLNADYENAELGYSCVQEVIAARMELDWYYKPEPLDAVVARYKRKRSRI